MDNPDDNNFQVSVKGLFFNDESKLMMMQKTDGIWEPPGGRIQTGEEFSDSLKRECREETGIECEILDPSPAIVYPTVNKGGKGRIMIFFRIKFKTLAFKPSSEYQAIKFFAKEEMEQLSTYTQLKPLMDFF